MRYLQLMLMLCCAPTIDAVDMQSVPMRGIIEKVSLKRGAYPASVRIEPTQVNRPNGPNLYRLTLWVASDVMLTGPREKSGYDYSGRKEGEIQTGSESFDLDNSGLSELARLLETGEKWISISMANVLPTGVEKPIGTFGRYRLVLRTPDKIFIQEERRKGFELKSAGESEDHGWRHVCNLLVGVRALLSESLKAATNIEATLQGELENLRLDELKKSSQERESKRQVDALLK